jgi:hypothetical protein
MIETAPRAELEAIIADRAVPAQRVSDLLNALPPDQRVCREQLS